MRVPTRTSRLYLGVAAIVAVALLLPLHPPTPAAPAPSVGAGAPLHARASVAPTGAPSRGVVHPPGVRSRLLPAAPAGWQRIASGVGPSVRGSSAVASSSVDNVTLLYSGSHPGQRIDNETWELANGAWTNLTPTLSTSPGPAADAGLVYDAADGYFLLFGGLPAFGGTAANFTWKFQNGTWTNLTGTTTSTPEGRFGGAMVYDARDGYVLLFGGYGTSNQPLGDTWRYSGGTWTEQYPTTSPSARVYSAATYDERLGEVLLYGGQVYDATWILNDTWAFAAGAWTNITATAGAAPEGRRGPTMAYDPSYGVDVLFGGNNYSAGVTYQDTWLFTDGHWRNVTSDLRSTPAARFLAVTAFDPTTDRVVMFGGCTAVGCVAALNDTESYAFDLGSATLMPSVTVIAANGTLRLTAAATGGSFEYSYAYTGLPSGCASANVSVIVCQPAVPGNYTPSVTITDLFAPALSPAANVTATSATIDVLPPLTVGASVSRSTLDIGQTVWINVSAAGGGGTRSFSYTGLPGGCASANVASLTCVPTVSGLARVTASVHDTTGGLGSATVSFTVQPALVASVHASAAEIEVGQTVTFTASAAGGSGGDVFAWPALPPGCTVAGPAAVNCTPAIAGTLNVSVLVNDSNGAEAVGVSGLVLVVAHLTASAATAPASGVAPLLVSFTSAIHGGIGPFVVGWSFGDGTGSTAANASHIYATPGGYTAEFSVEDAAGFWANETLLVSVAPAPAVLVAASPSSIDVGQSTTLSAVPSNLSGALTYTWTNLPRGCPAANASSLSCAPTVSGNYSIHLAVAAPTGESAQSGTYLLVLPPVTVSITASSPSSCSCACGTLYLVNFSSAVSGGDRPYTYLWSFGDGATAGTATASHSYATVGAGSTLVANLTVNDSLGEQVSATKEVAVPPSSCATPGGTSGSSIPWPYVALGVVALVAVAAVAVLLARRRRSRGGEAPEERGPSEPGAAEELPESGTEPPP